MLHFDRSNVSEGIDINKTRESKGYDIFNQMSAMCVVVYQWYLWTLVILLS